MNNSTVIQFIVIAIAAGTPLVFGSVGEILCEKAGVMNLGIEGMMLLGGVVAYAAAVSTGSLFLGVLAGAAAGAALSLVHAVLTITLRGNQVVSGIGLVLLGSGLAAYLGDIGSTPLTNRPLTSSISPIFTAGPADLPVVGPILFGQDVLVYVSWALVAATAFYLNRTRKGLSLRAVGEDPATADSTGISVTATRYVHVLIGGALSGVGGAYLTLALFAAWQPGISAGSGWIAFALVIFAGWRPWRALFGAYAFGALTSIGFNLQLLNIPLSLALLSSLPYLLTLIGLVVISNTRLGRNRLPISLGVPTHGRRTDGERRTPGASAGNGRHARRRRLRGGQEGAKRDVRAPSGRDRAVRGSPRRSARDPPRSGARAADRGALRQPLRARARLV